MTTEDHEIDRDNYEYDRKKEQQKEKTEQNKNNDNDTEETVKDINGNTLSIGDTVIFTQTMKVKGTSGIKKGDKFTVKNLADDHEGYIEAKSKSGHGILMLKTNLVKRI